MICRAAEERERLFKAIEVIIFKLEDEIRETGIPLPLPALHTNLNLPQQLARFEQILNDLIGFKRRMIEEKERLFKSAVEMYKEEIESLSGENCEMHEELPLWIHSLFQSTFNSEESFEESSSFTTAAISKLDAAIDKMDPFHPSLSDSLAQVEAAHFILQGRLEIFKAEYDRLLGDLSVLSSRLAPFSESEIKNVFEASQKVLQVLQNNSQNSSTDLPTRSSLRSVLNEWRRVEKERSESISGSVLLIGRLWSLLETPQEERFPLNPTDLSLINMSRLSEERYRLINFQQQKFRELFDSQVQELRKLMVALKWPSSKQDSVLSGCQSYTADGLQLLSRQIAILQPKLEISLQIISIISARYALIEKMREFEKSASDPARLFRSSFQLLQEEKFRKSALPNLLNLEQNLKNQLLDYKNKFSEDFYYENEVISYQQILEDEIAGRFVSSGIFGFDQSKQRKERQTQTNPQPSSASAVKDSTPRYTNTSKNPAATISNINRSTAAINVIPQRRRLEK